MILFISKDIVIAFGHRFLKDFQVPEERARRIQRSSN